MTPRGERMDKWMGEMYMNDIGCVNCIEKKDGEN